MRTVLIVGDVVAMALVTVIGFASHNELGTAPWIRLIAVFVPLTAAWFLLAPFLDLFDEKKMIDAQQLWRVLLAAFFVGPFAALMRAFLLKSTVIPIFAVVLSGTAAVGLLVWRGLVWIWLHKNKP